MTSREPETGTESRKDRRHAAGRRRLKLFLQVLSVVAAFIAAFFVLFFLGGFEAGQGVGEDAGPVALPEVVPSALNAVGEVVSPGVAGPVAEKTAPGFDAGELEARLREIAEDHQGVYGVAVMEPESGTSVSLRGDEEFVAASIGKLPPLAALYRAAARGDLDLDEEIDIQSEDYQTYGSGSLHAYPEGYSLTLRDAAYYLVNHSDNTAWAMLDRRLGEEEIRDELESMGAEDSRYEGHDSGYYTTPEDVLLLLQKISDPTFTNEELSGEMLDAMTETVFEDRIPEKLPSEVRVAHKIGSYGNNFGDAGVVYYKDSAGVEKHYYLVVLSEGAGEYEARDAIQEISLAVYEALTGTTVDPEWSRGGEDDIPESEAPPVAPTPTPPPVSPPAPAEKAGGGRVEESATPPAKAPVQEKTAPKAVEQPPPKVQPPPPATRYGSSYYPPAEYAPSYARESQGAKDYYYYYEVPEYGYYSEQY